jgi:hypothetical protein
MNKFARTFAVLLFVLVGCAPARPPAFSGDLITVVEACAESNTTAYTVNGTVTVKSANGDGILRCLYASDVKVVFRGDPVAMREVAP